MKTDEATHETYLQTLRLIAEGAFTNEQLHALTDAATSKLKIERRKTAASLRPGDKVRLSGIRPAKLNGQVYEVIQVNKTRLVVNIPMRGRCTVPMTCCEKVED